MMKRTHTRIAVLALALTAALVAAMAAPGCTGAEVARLSAELDRSGAEIAAIEAGIGEIRAALEGLWPEQRARAEPYLATLAQTLAEVQARADGIGQRLAELETTEGKSAGNFLLAAGEIAASFGGLLPPPFGALVLAAGTAAGGIGTAINRRIAAEVVRSIEVGKRVVTPESPTNVVNFDDETVAAVIRERQSAATRRFVDRVQAA
jgi:hypothetical protein